MTSSGGGSPMVASRSRVAALACALRNNAVAIPTAPRIKTLRSHLMIAPPTLFQPPAFTCSGAPSGVDPAARYRLFESYMHNMLSFK
jgi:hypothetical protein